MEITLERVNSDYLFEAKNTHGHRVFLDNRSKKSGVVRGVSPMEVLLMGLAGCSSIDIINILNKQKINPCLLYTSPSPRDRSISRMPSSA